MVQYRVFLVKFKYPGIIVVFERRTRMRADEARKAVEQTEKYSEKERLIIEQGLDNINRAIKSGRMSCQSGLHFRNENHWRSIINYWESLGYTIVWKSGGGINPPFGRMPSTLEW